MDNNSFVKNITIANGATTSEALELPKTYYLAGLIKDTSHDTSTAITFTVSMDGITYTALKTSAGANVSITVASATAEAMAFTRELFWPWKFIKFVVANAQTGVSTYQCVLRQF